MRCLARLAARFLSVLLILLVLVILDPMSEAFAAGTTANAVITFPTVYISGQALPASDIAAWNIQWTLNGVQQATINAPATTTSVTILCGAVSFTATVTTSSTAAFPGLTSDPSPPFAYDSGVKCKPGAPALKVS